jgi:hypothetical protein
MEPASCERGCTRHREHVYVICYGEPFLPDQADCDYPVLHYVGYTAQHPPIRRVWSHGRGSAAALTGMRPGNLRDELRVKLLGKCARCGKPLWYYKRSPSAADYARAGLFVNLRENRRMRLHLKRRSPAGNHRLHPEEGGERLKPHVAS